MSSPPSPTLLERLQAKGARALFGLPRPIKRWIAGPARSSDGLRLDPDMQLGLRLLELNPRISLGSATPAEIRASLGSTTRILAGHPDPLASVEDLEVAGAAGALPARLYVPAEVAGQPSALIVYFHGGGWVAGDLDTHDAPCRLLANAAGARVLSVDYRRPPEAPFPAPVDDALVSFRDAVACADELDADPARIAVAGDSAGGHLAAVVSMLAALDDGPSPALQALIYPVIDCLNVSESRVKYAEGHVLTKTNMEVYESHFLSGGGERSDPRVSPLLADDLSGVAPALVVTAGFDILRDEGEAYAAKLARSGVRTILRRYEGYAHGFASILGLWPGPREALAEIGGMVRAELTPN